MATKGHKHIWEQTGVTIAQGKGGRVTGLTVRWSCTARRCGAETFTELAVRKPAATAKPKAPNAGWSRSEIKAAVERGKTRRRETGESLAAQAADDDFEELETEFERPVGAGNGKPRTVEETRQALQLYAPLTLRDGG